MPKKGSKKKGKKNEEKKEEKVEVVVETGQWIKLKFVLLEEDWNFADHELFVEARHPILYIERQVKDYHGKIDNLIMYRDKQKQERITNDFRCTMQEIFKDPGAINKESAKTHTIYYEYNVAIDVPLLNYDNFVIKQPYKHNGTNSWMNDNQK